MNKHYLFYGALIVAALALSALWVRGLIANARAEEQSKAHAANMQYMQQQKDAADKATAAAVSALEAEKSKPATIGTVTKYLPAPPPSGSSIEVRKPTVDDKGMPCSPDLCPPDQGEVVLKGNTQDNLNWIRDMEISHQQCDAKLDGCKKDAAIAADQLKQMTADRDTWKQTAQGGSKWKRFTKGLKVIGCAGGGAAIGALTAKTKGAAIGGAAGAAGCQIFW